MIEISRSDFSLKLRQQDGIDVMDIVGELDSLTVSETMAEFRKLTDASRYRIALGFEQVDYINSAGVGIILALAQHVRSHMGAVKLFGLKAHIRKVFDLVGASKVLEIFETEQEALGSFS